MTKTTAAVEETADEIKPSVDEQDRETAYRSDSNPGTATSETSRATTIAPGVVTDRRKEAVAHVRIVPSSRQWAINGHTLEDYLPNKAHQRLVSDPFAAVGVMDSYDIITRIDGGGITRQAGIPRLGIARALNEIDIGTSYPALKRTGVLTRDAHVKECKKTGLRRVRKAPQCSGR